MLKKANQLSQAPCSQSILKGSRGLIGWCSQGLPGISFVRAWEVRGMGLPIKELGPVVVKSFTDFIPRLTPRLDIQVITPTQGAA